MRRGDFARSISKAGAFLQKIDFLRTMRNPTSLIVSKDFNKIALNHVVKHDELYFSALELNYYNILLSDYSVLQFSMSTEGEAPELRLSYIPNPSMSVELEPTNPTNDIRLYEELFRAGDIDFEEFSQALSEMELCFSAPVIRVDASYQQFKKIHHPAVHMHIGLNNTSRLALDRVWSPFLFTLFIIKNFYNDIWLPNSDDDFSLEALLISEKDKLNQLDGEHFCQIQKGLVNLL